MNKKIIFIFILILEILLNFYGENFTFKKLTYKILDNEKVSNKQFVIGVNEQGYILRNTTSIVQFDKNFVTLNYEVFDKNNSLFYKVLRIGNKLEVKGKETDMIFTIDNDVWCQSYASWLPVFLKSSDKSIKFWMLTGNFDPESKEKNKGLMIKKFVLKKVGLEKIMDNNTEIETMKIVLTLPDARSAFWETKHWFRVSDGVRIKYEENRGPGSKTISGQLINEDIFE